jgi:cellobiose-specific phosphotransferase system component IIB
MPLTAKGIKIKKAMMKHYGKIRGKKVFFASQNKGTIKGTHK